MPRKTCKVCKQDSGGKYFCKLCAAEHSKETQKRRIERKNAGLCTNCGKEKDDENFRMCLRCQTKESEKTRKRNKQRKEAGICAIGPCNNTRLSNHRFCVIHREEWLKKDKKRSLKLIDDGLCTSCGSEKYMDCFENRLNIQTKSCQTCYLKMLSVRHLKTVSRWKELFNILIKQNYMCPYTGDKLVLGVNDSIDHILPRGRYPEKSHDINNLRWVTRNINNMKYDLIDDEFCKEISKIVKHLGADPKIATGPQA
jgi:5-methylcytosine-specific restriction endonuclease McrA